MRECTESIPVSYFNLFWIWSSISWFFVCAPTYCRAILSPASKWCTPPYYTIVIHFLFFIWKYTKLQTIIAGNKMFVHGFWLLSSFYFHCDQKSFVFRVNCSCESQRSICSVFALHCLIVLSYRLIVEFGKGATMRIENTVFDGLLVICAALFVKFTCGLDAEFGRIVTYNNFDQYKVQY